MRTFGSFAGSFARRAAKLDVLVSFTSDRGWGFRAAYTKG